MSLVDQGFSSGYSAPSEDFGRTPPQDTEAEKAVLGGMMLSKDAIADVLEVVRGIDFYRPAHELVFDAILDLYGRSEPADALTIADELTKRGQLGRVGGVSYLHSLINSVPTAANAGFYADIVRERAILRRLVQAGTRIVQLGYAPDGGDVDALVNEAQAEVYQVTERQASEDYVPLAMTIQPTIEEIEASEGSGDQMIGVPTGFSELDQLTNGLHPGQMIVIAARPAMGKALALDTPLATPTGWTSMGDVAVGDELLAADGSVTTVVAATEVMIGRPCYEVCFDDGSTIVADAWHQWVIETGVGTGQVERQVRTSEELVVAEHAVRQAAAVELPTADLLADPYLLGVWLAAGRSGEARAHVTDDELVMRLEGLGLAVEPLTRTQREVRLPEVGLPVDDPQVPAEYLRASAAQRWAVLAGLLDAGGSVSQDGQVQFSTSLPKVRASVYELLVSLGLRVTVLPRESRGVGGRRCVSDGSDSTRWTLSFVTTQEVFTLPAAQLLHKERTPIGSAAETHRLVVAVRPVASVPVRCVQIAHEEHLYLAGRSMVPTHNSTVGLDIARSAAIRNGMAAVIFSLEMTRTEITMRLLSAEASVSLQNMRKGTMREDDWQKLAMTTVRVNEAPLFIDDSPNMSLMEIRAKCRRLKQRHDLKLVVIDYLQLMTSGKRVESRQQEVSEFSRALKLLAKEIEVPVIAISQLNRGAEQRTDKKPVMSDLRESGSIEQDADMVILLHREDAYEKESPRAGEADFIVAKHRNGPTATLVMAFQGHYSRFVDMAHEGY